MRLRSKSNFAGNLSDLLRVVLGSEGTRFHRSLLPQSEKAMIWSTAKSGFKLASSLDQASFKFEVDLTSSFTHSVAAFVIDQHLPRHDKPLERQSN